MLWIVISLFFIWCGFREIRNSLVPAPGFSATSPVSKTYLAIVIALAALFAWPVLHTWYFELYLAKKATELADNHRATVHCNTMFDTMLDPAVFASGHANPQTGKIVFQKPWCGTLMSYLRHPSRASVQEIQSLDIFTHESMHIRGELNEALTECEAVQRNYRAAKMLGVADSTAKKNALDYYNISYRQRAQIGGMQGAYYSDQCAPGKAMDEHLSDSTWAVP
jgi:hypothetical protein